MFILQNVNKLLKLRKYSTFKLSDYDRLLIEKITNVLHDNRLKDVFVVQMKHTNICSFNVSATASSKRHLIKSVQVIKSEFKKFSEYHTNPYVSQRLTKEILENLDWVSLNIQSINLHILLEKVREYYDLESFWIMGSTFDEELESVEGY
ncbi:hypothetical protein A3Q56_00820 [Intoshia linei]|uniref:Uncharacterized protein n=1 Tax=Intoshia linei TaxID=1819745 RepID=A0A177BAS4_9BILA|nr:hypothetical protein A3Q56_00820 [Intoshia linei]